MKRIIVASLVAAGLSVSLMGSAAAQGEGHAYGKVIKEQCGGPYGEGVSMLRHLQNDGELEEHPNPVGAKWFVESGAIDFHCGNGE